MKDGSTYQRQRMEADMAETERSGELREAAQRAVDTWFDPDRRPFVVAMNVLRAALATPPDTDPSGLGDSDDAYNARMMEAWAALTDEEHFAAHQDDSYGSCVICLEYIPHTDDESVGVKFPCAVVQLAAIQESRAGGAALRASDTPGLDVERARRCIVQASIDMANGDYVAAHEELAVARAALSSPEPNTK